MFQNIAKDFENKQGSYEDVEFKKKNDIKEVITKVFTKQNIVLYIVCFLISMVKFNLEGSVILPVFGVAILAAALSNCIPIGIIFIVSGIGTFISSGTEGVLAYLFTSLVLFITTAIRKPIIKQEQNEKRRIGIHLFISVLIVNSIPMVFTTFYLYEFLIGLLVSVSIVLFYKIFASSLTVVKDFGEKKVFSTEEVIGASLLIAIAVTAFEPIKIFGFSLKNILSILIVLILGWKHGILIGGASGITIGVVLGIISNGEPIMIASYAISGMIAGLFNKLGKIRCNCWFCFRKCSTYIRIKWKCSSNYNVPRNINCIFRTFSHT